VRDPLIMRLKDNPAWVWGLRRWDGGGHFGGRVSTSQVRSVTVGDRTSRTLCYMKAWGRHECGMHPPVKGRWTWKNSHCSGILTDLRLETDNRKKTMRCHPSGTCGWWIVIPRTLALGLCPIYLTQRGVSWHLFWVNRSTSCGGGDQGGLGEKPTHPKPQGVAICAGLPRMNPRGEGHRGRAMTRIGGSSSTKKQGQGSTKCAWGQIWRPT
jgi:hypothetical protein